MTDRSEVIPFAPPRLVDGDDAIAALLREVRDAPAPPGPPAQEIVRNSRGSLIPKAATLALAASILMTWGWSHWSSLRSPHRIVAETVRTNPMTLEDAFVEDEPLKAVKPVTDATEPENETVRSPRRGEPFRVSTPPASLDQHKQLAPTNAQNDSVTCAELSTASRYDEALACYEIKAAETGMSGELALIESARIQWRVNGSPAAALSKLSEYERRFSGGALALEARLLKVRLLDDARGGTEALTYLREQLDAHPEWSERLVPLGTAIAVRNGDCAAARRIAEIGGPDTRVNLGTCAQVKAPPMMTQ